jgi:hypothetical protein
MRGGTKSSTSTVVAFQSAHALVSQGTEVSSPAVNVPKCKPVRVSFPREETKGRSVTAIGTVITFANEIATTWQIFSG